MDLQLQEQVAVVTGGSGGIGWAIAAEFASEGVKVAIWDQSANVAAVANEYAQSTSATVIGLQVDITDRQSIEAAKNETIGQLGNIDHLVHAAAIGSGKFGFPFTNLAPEDWPRILEVNVMGMTNVAHAIAPAMMEHSSGTMTFISSVAGQIGSPTDPPYSASKAANINFAQCMAKDLAPYRIRVNTVCPGMVKTALNESVWKAWHDQQPAETRKDYESWAQEKIQHMVPLGTWQSPRDIAAMVVFLSSARAAQVTGQTINVDGGFVMHW